MKIAIVCHDLSGGGAERVAATLASGLVQRNHIVTLFVERETLENVAYVDRLVGMVLLDGKSRARRTWSLARHLRTGQYEIVYAINPLLTLQALVARFLSGAKRTAVIGSYHSFYSGLPGVLSKLSFFLTPLITRVANKTICVSNALKSNLVNYWYAREGGLLTIYNPVATSPLSAPFIGASGIPSDYILFVGRLTADKNPALALKAFAMLPERFSELCLIVLGDGPLLGDLKLLARSLNVYDKVHFEGYVVDPWKYYTNAKALLSTSNSEAFSLVIVEAMAYGVPIVATESGGPREILDEGRLGWLVPLGDEKLFSRALAGVIETPIAPDRLRARANEFRVASAVDAYEQSFRRIASNTQHKE